MKPFKNLYVVELASVLAGPSVGMFFGELGAKVLKIENKINGGDVTRTWRTAYENRNEISNYYASVNGFKKVVFKDLNVFSDLEFVINEIKKADILLMNFKTADVKKFNLSYTKLKRINPKLIAGWITGYGTENSRPAFDLILQAESGFMSINATSGGMPLKMPVALIDVLAAHQLKEGILTALLLRQKNNKGKLVEVSLMDTALSSLINQGSNYLNTGIEPIANGSLHPSIAPYGETFKTKDNKFFVLAIGTDKQFEKLLTYFKVKPEFKFSTNANRVINRTELYRLVEKHIQKHFSEKLVKDLTIKGIPCSVVLTIGEAMQTEAALKLKLIYKSGILKGKTGIKSTVFNLKE